MFVYQRPLLDLFQLTGWSRHGVIILCPFRLSKFFSQAMNTPHQYVKFKHISSRFHSSWRLHCMPSGLEQSITNGSYAVSLIREPSGDS